MAATAAAFLVVLLAIPAVYAEQYIIGGTNGWNNYGAGFYDSWATAFTFRVGDTLQFFYDGSKHQVTEVSKSDYENCVSSNAIKTYSDGATTIQLTKAGTRYFICPVAGHCNNGMKMAVQVVAAASTTPTGSPTTPSTPSPLTPPGSTTPSTDTPGTDVSSTDTPSTDTPTTTNPTTTNSPLDNGASSTWGMRNLALGILLVVGASAALVG